MVRQFMTAVLLLGAAPVSAMHGDKLERLEAAKWHPASIGDAKAFSELFAPDFTTVEYGADPMGLVTRHRGALTGNPQIDDKLIGMLNATEFKLSEMQDVRPSPTVVILSYRISAPAIGWTAYATSVWAKRKGKWQTVFYQASRAKP